MKDTILFGDCRESLKTIATSDTKARMCVTSPPYYGLRDYGTATWIGCLLYTSDAADEV